MDLYGTSTRDDSQPDIIFWHCNQRATRREDDENCAVLSRSNFHTYKLYPCTSSGVIFCFFLCTTTIMRSCLPNISFIGRLVFSVRKFSVNYFDVEIWRWTDHPIFAGWLLAHFAVGWPRKHVWRTRYKYVRYGVSANTTEAPDHIGPSIMSFAI